jgi:hypothetical protein
MVTGRPGPVVLDVPFDIFKEDAGDAPDPFDPVVVIVVTVLFEQFITFGTGFRGMLLKASTRVNSAPQAPCSRTSTLARSSDGMIARSQNRAEVLPACEGIVTATRRRRFLRHATLRCA